MAEGEGIERVIDPGLEIIWFYQEWLLHSQATDADPEEIQRRLQIWTEADCAVCM